MRSPSALIANGGRNSISVGENGRTDTPRVPPDDSTVLPNQLSHATLPNPRCIRSKAVSSIFLKGEEPLRKSATASGRRSPLLDMRVGKPTRLVCFGFGPNQLEMNRARICSPGGKWATSHRFPLARPCESLPAIRQKSIARR